MPTGYTADVATGKISEFSTFAMSCARAFGALVTMRDDPSDAPIPEKLEPSDHHALALPVVQAELDRLQRLSPDEIFAERDAAEERRLADFSERQRDKRAQRQRYENMLAEVEAWDPPTPDHQGIKDFMREQLTESIKFDCSPSTYGADPLPPAREWHKAEIEKAQRMVDYHTKSHAEEVERTNGRNEWISALRASLP